MSRIWQLSRVERVRRFTLNLRCLWWWTTVRSRPWWRPRAWEWAFLKCVGLCKPIVAASVRVSGLTPSGWWRCWTCRSEAGVVGRTAKYSEPPLDLMVEKWTFGSRAAALVDVPAVNNSTQAGNLQHLWLCDKRLRCSGHFCGIHAVLISILISRGLWIISVLTNPHSDTFVELSSWKVCCCFCSVCICRCNIIWIERIFIVKRMKSISCDWLLRQQRPEASWSADLFWVFRLEIRRFKRSKLATCAWSLMKKDGNVHEI